MKRLTTLNTMAGLLTAIGLCLSLPTAQAQEATK